MSLVAKELVGRICGWQGKAPRFGISSELLALQSVILECAKLFQLTINRCDNRGAFLLPDVGDEVFVLFVNESHLLTEPFARFLESQIRHLEPYVGLPILLRLRRRTESDPERRHPARKA